MSLGKKMKPVGVVFATAAFLSGCGASAETPAEQLSTPNVAYVASPNHGQHYQHDNVVLNRWLKQNPGRRVVAFTGILDYRSENSGYQLVTKPGANTDESFDEVSIPEAEGVQSSPSKALQQWQNQHLARSIIGLASVPEYSGGAEAYVICSVPTER